MFELLFVVVAGAFVVDEPPNTNGLELAVLFVLDEPNIEPELAVVVLEPNTKGFGSVLTVVVVDEDAPKPEPNTLELLLCPNTDPVLFSFCLISAGLSLLAAEKANSEGAVLLGAVVVEVEVPWPNIELLFVEEIEFSLLLCPKKPLLVLDALVDS